MRINQHLQKFPKKTMFIVTGKQDARFYFANDESIQRVASFRIKKPNYSDREGFYQSTSPGIHGMQSGSVLRPVDRAIRLEFRHTLANQVDTLLQAFKIEQAILFAPQQFLAETTSFLPKKIQTKLTYAIGGNLFKNHPFDLIKRYQVARLKTMIKV